VPGKRAKGERLLEDALAAPTRALDEAGAPWMVIGGIAVIAHGVRRFTTDIDAAVLGDAIAPRKVACWTPPRSDRGHVAADRSDSHPHRRL